MIEGVNPQPPVVEAASADANAVIFITQAEQLPGSASILVTAEDGETQKEYIITFQLSTHLTGYEVADIRLFPNPADDYIYVYVNGNVERCHYFIFDLTGKRLQTGVLHESGNLINLSHLQPGLYIMKITSPSDLFSRRFQIVR